MIRRRFVIVAVSCLFLASCMAMPGPGDYGPQGDLQEVRVIIAPQGATAPPKSAVKNKKPFFDYRIGIFNFLAETDAISERLAIMAHQHLLNLQRFRTIGLINLSVPLAHGPGRLSRAVELGRQLGYDLILVGEALDVFSGVVTGPSRVGLRIRIIDTKRASTVWLVMGRRAVRPRPMRDYLIFQSAEKPAPDAMSLAHYLLQAMLERI